MRYGNVVFSLLLYERTRVGERHILAGYARELEFYGVRAGIRHSAVLTGVNPVNVGIYRLSGAVFDSYVDILRGKHFIIIKRAALIHSVLSARYAGKPVIVLIHGKSHAPH